MTSKDRLWALGCAQTEGGSGPTVTQQAGEDGGREAFRFQVCLKTSASHVPDGLNDPTWALRVAGPEEGQQKKYGPFAESLI